MIAGTTVPDAEAGITRPFAPADRASPSRGAYLTLVATLLVAGAFAGTFLGTGLRGSIWAHAQMACFSSAGPPPSDPVQMPPWVDAFTQCTAPISRAQSWWGVAGAATCLLIGLGLMLLLAGAAARRARPRTAPTTLQERIERLSAAAGLRSIPRVAIASSQVRDPYTAGRPGRTTILVPAGLMGRPEPQVDAALMHELAHVEAGDVTLVWFTRGVWWAIVPVLLTPLLILETRYARSPTFQWSNAFSLVSDYLARAAVLLAVTAVLSYSVLRSREHEADLRVSGAGLRAPLISLLSAGRTQTRRWKSPFATHPSPSDRITMLHDPGQLAVPRGLDTFFLALLLSTTWWAVRDLAHGLLAGTPLSGSASLIAGLLTGALLAATIGTALLRQALAGIAWSRQQRWQLLTSFAVGSIAGQVVSVALTAGGTWSGPWQRPTTLILPTALLLGAIGLCQALATSWAARRPGPTMHPTPRVLFFSCALAVFTAATWYGQDAQVNRDLLGLDWWSSIVLLCAQHATSAALITVYVAVVLACLARGRASWGSAVAALALSAATLLAYAQTSSGSHVDWGTQIGLDPWIAAAVGGGCVLAALVITGIEGLATAVICGPAATLTAAGILFLVRNGSWADPHFADPGRGAVQYLTQSLSILTAGLFTIGVVAGCGSAGGSQSAPRARRARWVPLAAAAISAVLTLAVLRSGTVLLLN